MAVDPSLNYDDKARLKRPVTAVDTLPTATVHPSFLQNLTESVSQPDGIAGMGMGATPAQYQQGVDAGQRAAAATAAATATPASFAGTQGGASVGLHRLAPGVSRYALGGDVAGPNATPIYTTRGKNGEAVFTDNADFAAQQSTGGLRRGDVNSDVYNNAQENAKFNPNAGYQFSDQSALNQKGLQRRDFQNLDPGSTAQALALATAGSGAGEEGLANRMDANLLRARQVAQQNGTGGAYALPDGSSSMGAGGAGGIPVAQQIALMRAKSTAAYQQGRLKQGQQQIDETVRARDTSAKQADRQQAADIQKQYSALQATSPEKASSFLASQLPSDPDKLKDYLNTVSGRLVASNILEDVVSPAAADSLTAGNPTAKTNASQLRFSHLALDPKTGAFQGFRAPGDEPGTNDPTYPATRGLLRRIEGFVPGSGVSGAFTQHRNYPSAINNLSPAQLKVLQSSGL